MSKDCCILQVWGMVLLNQESRLLTGSADSELRAWDIDYLEEVSTLVLFLHGNECVLNASGWYI